MFLNSLKYFNIIFWFLMGLAIGPFVLSTGPILESKFLPVVTSSKITRIQEISDPTNIAETGLLFWGEAQKLRECQYDHTEWFSGDPNGAHSRLTIEVKGKPVISKKGDTFEYGPIKVYINEVQLRNNTFAVVYHRCHAVWLSQSTFYP